MNYYLRHPHFRVSLFACGADLLCIGLAAGAIWLLAAPPVSGPAFFVCSAALGVLSFLLLATLDGYLPEVLGTTRRSTSSVLMTMGITAFSFGVACLAAPGALTTLATLAGVAVVGQSLQLAVRPLYRAIIIRPVIKKRAIILGHSELGIATADAFASRKNIGIELVGFLVGDLDDLPREISGYPVVGRTHQLEKVIDNAGIDIVIVASKRREEQFPVDQLLHAKLRGLRIESGIEFYERLTGRIYLRDLRPSYLVFSEGFHTGRFVEAVSRVFDVGFSAFGLLIASPLLLIAAIAIKLDSPGPLLYRQERTGRFGRTFHVLKLRTMSQDAERESGPTFTAEGDARVTRVGNILRMTRLDEVPQYWNVLRGDMALVGPRPERPEFIEMLNARYPFFALRTACKPGLTGWAQVRFGYVNRVEDFEDKLGLDLYYLKHRSPLMDLMIVFQTVKTVLFFRGL
jgi:exopolysaccharide biosynthesis polyprenyl glycosylphosphotransferase